MLRKLPKSYEEKIAEKLANEMKDSTLNLDQVGFYLGRMLPSYLLNRLAVITEAGKYEQEIVNGQQQDRLFD
jgi:hypothetical protein